MHQRATELQPDSVRGYGLYSIRRPEYAFSPSIRGIEADWRPATKNVSSTMCGVPVRDESSKPLLIGVVGGAIALVAFILRMLAIIPIKGGKLPGWDDYTIIIASALTVPPTVFAVLRTCMPLPALGTPSLLRIVSHNGLGKDIWTLPLNNIENILLVSPSARVSHFIC